MMSVSQWGYFMGLHPWHLNQLANSLIPLNSKCSALVYESTWQNADRAGRLQIRQAIAEAERLMHQYSRIWPSPRYIETTLPYPPLGDTRYTRWNDVGGQGRWLNVQLPDAEIIGLGPAVESDVSTVALVYSDQDGDNLFETATTTAVVTSGTTADQIVARFLAADCGPVSPPEITPRSVSVSGTTATLIFDTYDLVRPVRYQGAASATLDPGNGIAPAATVCAPSIQVLRRRADPTGTTLDTAMAVLTWETTPWPSWCCVAPSSTDPAAMAQAIARAVIRDAHNGIVAFGEAAYDTTTSSWSAICDWTHCRPPDRVTLRYQAGGATGWDRELAQLAAAELNRGVCACDGANHAVYDAQKDLSQIGATDDLYQAPDDFSNPLGSRRGQIAAWRFLSQQQRLVGLYGG
jgi:hypothetical protein